jgi:NAD(P)H dehydrogenase (quinone)
MRVLAICAHPNPASFCHAVLEHFARGLKVAGHECEVLDLNAIGFDPVFRNPDYLQFVDATRCPMSACSRVNLSRWLADHCGES